MATVSPKIQVLSKQDYTQQHLVALPTAYHLPPLAPHSIRAQTTLFSLSTNNLTYARLAHLFNWWDIYPLPPCTPAEFADASKYGRISCWGFGTVLESTITEPSSAVAAAATAAMIPVGSVVYGYWPIGDLPVDLRVEMCADVADQFLERSGHRQPPKVMEIYNRYVVVARPSSSERTSPQLDSVSMGYDALMRILFETAYLLNRFVYTWDGMLSHPLGSGGGWTLGDADIRDAVVVVFAASGKTALSMAYLLRQGRPPAKQPRKLIGVTSKSSRGFVDGTVLYDEVMLYEDAASLELLEKLQVNKDTKVVFVDFGARDKASLKWDSMLRSHCKYLRTVRLASEVKHTSPEETSKALRAGFSDNVQVAGASGIRHRAMELQGESTYFEEFLIEWNAFKERGGINGLKLKWADGMENVCKAWDDLVEGAIKGDVGPDTGLLFNLPLNHTPI